jgi:hypothetical protein
LVVRQAFPRRLAPWIGLAHQALHAAPTDLLALAP